MSNPNPTAKEPTGTRGFPSPILVVGEALQSISLGILERGDQNASFATRAVGLITLALLLLVGSLIASFASPLSETLIGSALTVPVVRADLIFLLLSRLVLVFVWASKLRPNKLLYESEVYPLQGAAMIWNDCKPIQPNAREDGHSMILDILTSQRQLWKPTHLDTHSARVAKFPVFVIVQLLCWFFLLVEKILFSILRFVLDRGAMNQTLVNVQGKRLLVAGHTALITDVQLTWIQDFTMRGEGTLEQNREARRVLVRALHVANLLSHGGYTRLHEHSSGDHAMSEYFAYIKDNPVIKNALTKSTDLNILTNFPPGNKLERGKIVPKQVLWARLIVGSMLGLQGHGRWRGPVAAALYTVAQENIKQWHDYVSKTPLHRHVYTVSRRWLIDWLMFMWWEVEIPSALVYEPAAFFERLQQLLTKNLVHNTMSLPHAVGELAVSSARSPDVEVMLNMLLGNDWEDWMSSTYTVGRMKVVDAVVESGDWKCFENPVDGSVSVDSALYKQKQLCEVLETDSDSALADQVRACFAQRIVTTLVERVKNIWSSLPHQLLGPPEEKGNFEERLSGNDTSSAEFC